MNRKESKNYSTGAARKAIMKPDLGNVEAVDMRNAANAPESARMIEPLIAKNFSIPRVMNDARRIIASDSILRLESANELTRTHEIPALKLRAAPIRRGMNTKNGNEACLTDEVG